MANFMFLYRGGSMAASAAERAENLHAWRTWFDKLGPAIVDGGNPFTAQVKNIANDGAVRDGAIGTMATGYSIVCAETFDTAIALTKGCPHLQSGGQIEVYETFQAM